MNKNNKVKTGNVKKVDFKGIINSYKKFYKENLKKKHIIILAIMIVVFFSMLGSLIANSEIIQEVIETSQIVQNSFFTKLTQEKIPLLAIIIFAGITPFFFLSVLGIGGSYTLAFEVSYAYFMNGSVLSVVFGSIGSIIQIVAISLCVATGLYYCTQTTKKFRYNQHMSFGLKDVKKSIYEIRKDEEKLKELQEKEIKKAENREKLNVKVSYINLVISFVISTLILVLGAVICLI